MPTSPVRFALAMLILAAIAGPARSQSALPAESPDARYQALAAAFDAESKIYNDAVAASKTGAPFDPSIRRPDAADYARRFNDIAQGFPGTRAARDSLLWVLRGDFSRAGMDDDPWGMEVGRAVDLALASYADEQAFASVALFYFSAFTPARDRYLPGLRDKARDRSVRGTATLALAQYLAFKSRYVASIRGRTTRLPNMPEEYESHLRALDADALADEAEQLLKEVLADFADIPYYRPGKGGIVAAQGGKTLGDAAGPSLEELRKASIGRKAAEPGRKPLGPQE